MREELRGWYKPTVNELEELWSEDTTIVLDANALLYPYRIPVRARSRLFDLLRVHNDRLWCPYQAALEYQRSRLKVIAEQKTTYDDLRKRLRAAEKSLTQLRRDHPIIDADQFRRLVRRSVDALTRWIDNVEQSHPQFLGEDRDEDVVRDEWDELLTGKIGPRLAVDDAWKRAADKRYEAGIPPGFEDAKKGSARQYGDLIIWYELLAYVRTKAEEDNGAPIPVIFITDDSKSDWWRIEESQRLGPRPELVDELAEAGGRPFWMYSLPRFVTAGSERLGWPEDVIVEEQLETVAAETSGNGEKDKDGPVQAHQTTAPSGTEAGSTLDVTRAD